jgi:hypothetical protein
MKVKIKRIYVVSVEEIIKKKKIIKLIEAILEC